MADETHQEGKANTNIKNVTGSTINVVHNHNYSSIGKGANRGPSSTERLRSIFQFNLILFVVLVVLAFFVHFITTVIAANYYCENADRNSQMCKVATTPSVFIFQLIAIVVLMGTYGIFSINKALKRLNQLSKLAQDSFHQFLQGWVGIWTTWGIMYSFISLTLLLKGRLVLYNISLQVTMDFLNIANSLVFFYLFLVLDMPSVPAEEGDDRDEKFRFHFWLVLAACIVIFILTAISRFYQDSPIGFLIYSSGILVGMSMAYVVGRLDSHYMNVDRWLLAPLYVYAIVQPLGVKLIDFQNIKIEYQDEFFYTVIILKFLFFLIISVWLSTGYFDEYFDKGVTSVENRRIKESG